MRVTPKPFCLRSSAGLLRARFSLSNRSLLGVIAGVSFAALLGSPVVQAQTATPLLATPTVRVTAPVSNDTLVTLKGNVHPMAQARYDQGAASTSLATGKMELLLRRSPAQEEALREYMGGLQNPHSASYRKWLTPTSYGASFGIAAQDLQTVETWLESEGFKIEGVPASGNMIQFSGTFGQVGQAFHTSMHSYVIKGVQHYSNTSDPEIPAALAPVIKAISPLNDFHSKPFSVLGPRSQMKQTAGGMQVVSRLAGSAATPQFTDTTGGDFLYVTASDAATIYDAPNSLNRASGITPTTGGGVTGTSTGAGVNIGLVGDSDLQTSDYLNYRTFFLNETSPANPTLVVDGVDPGVIPGGEGEEALLDAENAAALAPGANIYFYSSNDDLLEDGALDAAVRAIEDNNVAVLSVSFGECEADLGPDGNEVLSEDWQQAAAQGITVVVAAGDSGSAACDSDAGANAQYGLAVSGFASTPYNIAVGGTDFDLLSLANNFATYVGGDSSTNLYEGSALGYIPENPWNDSISNNPPGGFSTNIATQYPIAEGSTTTTTIVAAGGGGPSTLGACPSGEVDENGNCVGGSTGYPIPSFQSRETVSGAFRGVPDVSLFASPGNQHDATWAFCSDSNIDQDTTQTYVDCQVGSDGSFYLDGIGGTSAPTPAFAGVLGMIIQSIGAGQRLGLANQVIYNLQAGTSGGSIFHDVTAGNNSVPCVSGSTTCGTNDFEAGYNAGTGYDLATGLGSVDISKLVSAWPSASFTATSTALSLNGGTAQVTIVHGTAVTLATTVAPSTATGTVSVVGPTSAAGAAVNVNIPLTSGAGSQSVDYLPGGSYSIHAYYPGDATDAPSTSAAIPVTVTPEASTAFLTVDIYNPDTPNTNPAQDPASATYGEYGFVYVTPANTNATTAGSNGPATGMVTLVNNGASYGTQALNSTGTAAFPLYGAAPGTYSFGASYGGDNSYSASTTTASVPLTITKGPTMLYIAASSTSIPASGSATISVELDTDSESAVYPSGAITLSNGSTSFPGTATNGVDGNGADAIFETFTVTGASLASGSNTLTASYGGDTNYLGAGSVSVAVNNSGGSSTSAGFNLTGPTNGITVTTPGTAATGAISIAPTNGFSGTVALSCQVSLSVGSAAPTCSVPASVAVTAGTAATATLTINSTATSAALRGPGNGSPAGSPLHRLLEDGGGVALASVLLLAIPARRRSWRAMLSVRTMLLALLAFGALGILGVIGCGGTSTSNGGGTSAGTYTVTVTGTSNGVTANTTVGVTIE
jgi:hypothetical protein